MQTKARGVFREERTDQEGN